MRLIAEYIMRGRMQAVMIALLGSLVPLLTQATLGLVSLRKGWQEGLLITLWGLLPTLGGYWIGDANLPLMYASAAVIVVSYIAAVVLRVTVSWSATLSSIVALSCLAALIAVFALDNIVIETQELFSQFLRNIDPSKREEILGRWNHTWCGGMIGLWVAVGVIFGVIVSRWWQAILFNPGGFRKEFHQMRLHNVVALVSLGAAIYCEFRGVEYGYWAYLFALPLIFAGYGLLHCIVANTKLGVGLLVVGYIGLFLIPPIVLIIAIAGFSDAWLDYRKRFNLMQQE